jgi:hypothetical protein
MEKITVNEVFRNAKKLIHKQKRRIKRWKI